VVLAAGFFTTRQSYHIKYGSCSCRGDKKPVPLIATPAVETHGQISPDGKWIAYTSNLTGRNEVYVQPFPSGTGRYQISNRGGDWPRWKRDGKELLYHAIAPALDSPAVNIPFGGPMLTAEIVTKAETLEIVAGMQRKNEVLIAQSLEAIHSLARIAESHEKRIDDLEGQA
jgi:hypothetical protein